MNCSTLLNHRAGENPWGSLGLQGDQTSQSERKSALNIHWKNWCFWTVVVEKTLESLLDCRWIKSVNPEGNQPWICFGRIGAEGPILWPSDEKSRLIGKDPNFAKIRAKGEGGDRGWELDGLTDTMEMSLSKLRETVKDRKAWHAAVHGVAKSYT